MLLPAHAGPVDAAGRAHREAHDVLEEGSVSAWWEPRERIVSIRFRRGPPLTTRTAEVVAERIDAWVAGTKRFSVLIDGNEWPGDSAEWNARWMTWLATHATRPRIALYGKDIDMAGAASFALSTGVDLRVFFDEKDGREWLARPESF